MSEDVEEWLNNIGIPESQSKKYASKLVRMGYKTLDTIKNAPPSQEQLITIVKVSDKEAEKIIINSISPVLKPKEQKPSESLLRKTVVRSIFGVAMMTGFYFLLQLPHKYTAGLVLVAQVMAWQELVTLRYKVQKERELESSLFRTINWYFLFLAFAYFYGRTSLKELLAANLHPTINIVSKYTINHYSSLLFGAYVIGLTTFILTLRRNTLRYQIGQLTWTIMSLLLVVAQTHFAIQYLYDGLIWILLPHGLIIVNDIAAYFVGVTFGNVFIARPLTNLSPNKTWEGFIGAMIITVLFGFFISPLFAYSEWLVCPADHYPCNLGIEFQPAIFPIPDEWRNYYNATDVTLYPIQIHSVFFALFASLIAPFGGFLASGIKRAYNKKDFDNLIPGHGGFMDRFDCQLLMCSFVYFYLNTFIKTSDAYHVANIMSSIDMLREDLQAQILHELQIKLA